MILTSDADHFPPMDIDLTEDPYRGKGNELRVKGGGEAGITPSPAAFRHVPRSAQTTTSRLLPIGSSCSIMAGSSPTARRMRPSPSPCWSACSASLPAQAFSARQISPWYAQTMAPAPPIRPPGLCRGPM